jgi:hypothetical protein
VNVRRRGSRGTAEEQLGVFVLVRGLASARRGAEYGQAVKLRLRLHLGDASELRAKFLRDRLELLAQVCDLSGHIVCVIRATFARWPRWPRRTGFAAFATWTTRSAGVGSALLRRPTVDLCHIIPCWEGWAIIRSNGYTNE